ncbi:hypothetical protein D3C73_1225600 [compost metagenome]
MRRFILAERGVGVMSQFESKYEEWLQSNIYSGENPRRSERVFHNLVELRILEIAGGAQRIRTYKLRVQ